MTNKSEQHHMSTLGQRVRAARKHLGLTLDDLARKTGSSKSYIWELENDSLKRPSAKKLCGIAEELGVTQEYLLNGCKIDDFEDMVDHAFFQRYQKLDRRTKDRLLKIMNVLTDGEFGMNEHG